MYLLLIFVEILNYFHNLRVNCASAPQCSSSTSALQGLYTPVFTPLTECGQVNTSVISEYAEYLVANGITKVLVTGTVGEGPAIPPEDRKRILDTWVAEAKSRNMTVMMQVGGLVFSEVLELARFSVVAQADSVLCLPELYYRPNKVDKLVDYIAKVAEEAYPLPVLYYDIPKVTYVKLSMPEFVKKATARIPNFAGLKTDLETGIAVLARNSLKDYQALFNVDDNSIASAHEFCINGSIVTSANIFPALAVALAEAALNGDVETARTLQLQHSRLLDAISSVAEKDGDIIAQMPFLKAGFEIVTGIRMGPTRDPIPKATPQQRKQIVKNLVALGVQTALNE